MYSPHNTGTISSVPFSYHTLAGAVHLILKIDCKGMVLSVWLSFLFSIFSHSNKCLMIKNAKLWLMLRLFPCYFSSLRIISLCIYYVNWATTVWKTKKFKSYVFKPLKGQKKENAFEFSFFLNFSGTYWHQPGMRNSSTLQKWRAMSSDGQWGPGLLSVQLLGWLPGTRLSARCVLGSIPWLRFDQQKRKMKCFIFHNTCFCTAIKPVVS